MLNQLAILSGKGGTGKTTVTAAFAQLAARHSRLVLVDADVDASNLGLLLAPGERERRGFFGGEVATIEAARCEACGACAQACRFDAIGPLPPYRVDPVLCEGCRSCLYQCPAGVIEMQAVQTGVWLRSETRMGPLFHAEQTPGYDNTGKLVTTIRRAALRWAEETHADLVLIDGPPGIGCPVIAASTGVQLAVMVVEPSVSAIHDLRRVVATVHHFGITPLVCVNKADLSPERTVEVIAVCDELSVEVVGRIPFDPAIPRAIIAGHPVTEQDRGPVYQSLADAWNRVGRHLMNGRGDSMRAVRIDAPGRGAMMPSAVQCVRQRGGENRDLKNES